MSSEKPYFSRFLEAQQPEEKPNPFGGKKNLDQWTNKWPSDSDDDWEPTFST